MKMSREMFEGKDYPTQWALNPSTYQNMSNDQGNPKSFYSSFFLFFRLGFFY